MLRFIRHQVSVKYLMVTTITIGLVFTALFFWLSHRQETFIMDQVRKQAIILHKQIVLTRQWVSDHRYVLIADALSGSAEAPAADAAAQGPARAYTRITPAALTRQLSNYATRDSLYAFNITNIDGKNPQNRPDAFEVQAITQFRAGKARSLSRVEQHNGLHVYRYAAPLVVNRSCLACHRDQQMAVGDIGGCISVFLPIESALQAIRSENLYLFLAMLGLTSTVLVTLYFSTRRMIFKPIQQIRRITRRLGSEKLTEAASTKGDELSEFTRWCYFVDEQLKDQHQAIERNIQDATRDLHDTNRQLAAANRDLSALNAARMAFFSDISHELRTPLTAIKGAADTLARKTACTEPAYVDIIRKNTEHLSRTIIDFLDYSKLEAGRLELDIEGHSLPDVIMDVVDTHTVMASQKNVGVIFNPDGDVFLPMDRHRIYQVVSNLLVNAIRYSPVDGSIVIEQRRLDGYVRVGIRDDGPGIDRAHSERVFEKFYQIPQDGKQLRNGSSGIGLAICKGVVEAHGGRIWVEGAPGSGSTFVFTLPCPGGQHPTQPG